MKLTREDFRNYIKRLLMMTKFFTEIYIFRKKIIRKLFMTTV